MTSPTPTRLSEGLVSQALNAARSLPTGDERGLVESASERTWRSAFRILREHRLESFVWYGLEATGQASFVPSDLALALAGQLKRSTNDEHLLGLSLLRATHVLSGAGISPLVCKGILLAREYYPVRGLRPMQDVDLWIGEDEMPRAKEVLSDAGFEALPQRATGSARSFKNSWGAVLDVHYRFALFESRGIPLSEVASAHPSDDYRVLQPEALLVHLVAHMLGHANTLGTMLCWVVDVALVLERHGAKMDWQRVRGLSGDEHVFAVVLRLLGMMVELGWCDAPLAVAGRLADVRPISFARMVRLRRLVPRQLATARGWARLALRRGAADVAMLNVFELPVAVKELVEERAMTEPRYGSLLRVVEESERR